VWEGKGCGDNIVVDVYSRYRAQSANCTGYTVQMYIIPFTYMFTLLLERVDLITFSYFTIHIVKTTK
jgi:hypothetical protein